jgi:hypothetical protein
MGNSASTTYTEKGICYQVSPKDGNTLMGSVLQTSVYTFTIFIVLSSLIISGYGLSSANSNKKTGLTISTVILAIVLISVLIRLFFVRKQHNDILKTAKKCTSPIQSM